MADGTDIQMDNARNQTVSLGAPLPADSGRRPVKIFCHHCQQKLDVTSLEPFSRFACPMCGTELIVPTWFDNYLLEEPVGTGGMATVYRALDIALDREVAIKILKEEVLPASELSDLFLNEARTAATINHYAVVPIYTCGICDGKTYIVMQFMNGGSLEQKQKACENLTVPVNDAVKWIHDIAEGLENAGKHGVIHHDVKPANIMLDTDDNVKIGDFGLAQVVKAEAVGTQKPVTAWVSPNYVSPERISTGTETYPGDIYSLGATFYHLVTGITPFSNPNIEELIWMRTRHNPVAPNQLRPDLAPELSSLIMKMMNRAPDMRPSYREIITTLEVYMKRTMPNSSSMRRYASSVRKSVPPVSPGVLKNGAPAPVQAAPAGAAASEAEPPVQPGAFQRFLYHPLVIITVSIFLLLVILVVAFLLFSSGASHENAMNRPERIIGNEVAS